MKKHRSKKERQVIVKIMEGEINNRRLAEYLARKYTEKIAEQIEEQISEEQS